MHVGFSRGFVVFPWHEDPFRELPATLPGAGIAAGRRRGCLPLPCCAPPPLVS